MAFARTLRLRVLALRTMSRFGISHCGAPDAKIARLLAMKKVRCPRCFVVNMERFVTFPYCASCGARLPVSEMKAVSAFRRPLGMVLWTSTIGATLLAIFAVVRVFEAPEPRGEDVVVYGRGPRSVRLGDEFVLQVDAEAVEGAKTRNPILRAVKLRVLRESFAALTLLEVRPAPDSVVDRGRARYFDYSVFDSSDAIKLRLRAARPGRQSLQMRFLVGGELQGISTFNFDVLPRDASNSSGKTPRKKSGAPRAEKMR